ncbi:hypothetical protein BV25DRAFT_1915979 [Artomyces pyxidatus]|uniref:Uncharacterized protein n=1 Tax=Artomyces pyxidatus TaxID=48021 RepID=A0ACB8T1U2_9AGAM|nr:hypothetical protein BV25DRAFT_1915979 [Artomyces pyxidatus]
MSSIAVEWDQRALNSFWGAKNGGTAEEKARQEEIMFKFVVANVTIAVSAEIIHLSLLSLLLSL